MSKKPFTYVGIHARLTDHVNYEKARRIIPVKPSYFLEAMDKYRQEFDNTLFIFVSDDIEYGRRNLYPRVKAGDLYFAGEGRTYEADS